MKIKAQIIKDSVSSKNIRCTTFQLTYPRFIHSEVMTHRDRARNSASSRAIPFSVLSEQVMDEPVIPIHWGRKQKGMQSSDIEVDAHEATKIWLEARDSAVEHAKRLDSMGVHKSLSNRIIEPYMWITVVMTATRWKNFLRLRNHELAERHFWRLAGLISDQLSESKPTLLKEKEWHMPYIGSEDHASLSIEDQRKVSAGRCAGVSYLKTDSSTEDALRVFDNLVSKPAKEGNPVHASPLEHVLENMDDTEKYGCFQGWRAMRHLTKGEDVGG